MMGPSPSGALPLVRAASTREVDPTVNSWARQWGPDVFRSCRQLLPTDTAAEEATRAAFLLAREDRHHLFELGSARRRLLSIARRVCLERLGLRRLASSLDDAARPSGAAAAPVANRALEHEVSRSLDLLPPETRALIVLRYVERMSDQAIADANGMTLDAVRAELASGLSQLMKALEAHGLAP